MTRTSGARRGPERDRHEDESDQGARHRWAVASLGIPEQSVNPGVGGRPATKGGPGAQGDAASSGAVASPGLVEMCSSDDGAPPPRPHLGDANPGAGAQVVVAHRNQRITGLEAGADLDPTVVTGAEGELDLVGLAASNHEGSGTSTLGKDGALRDGEAVSKHLGDNVDVDEAPRTDVGGRIGVELDGYLNGPAFRIHHGPNTGDVAGGRAVAPILQVDPDGLARFHATGVVLGDGQTGLERAGIGDLECGLRGGKKVAPLDVTMGDDPVHGSPQARTPKAKLGKLPVCPGHIGLRLGPLGLLLGDDIPLPKVSGSFGFATRHLEARLRTTSLVPPLFVVHDGQDVTLPHRIALLHKNLRYDPLLPRDDLGSLPRLEMRTAS